MNIRWNQLICSCVNMTDVCHFKLMTVLTESGNDCCLYIWPFGLTGKLTSGFDSCLTRMLTNKVC